MATRQRTRWWIGTSTWLAFAAISSMGSGPMHAATITFGYTGTITFTNGSIAEFGGLPFGVDDPISGTFTFDPDADPTSTTALTATYYSALKSATMTLGPVTITEDFVQTAASCSPAPDCTLPPSVYYEAFMHVEAAHPFDYSGQNFIVEAFALYPDLSPFLVMAVDLFEGRPGYPGIEPPLIASTDLPEVPWDPGLFEDAVGTVSLADSFHARFSVDDMFLVPVPEASLVVLLATAFVGIGCLRNRRRA